MEMRPGPADHSSRWRSTFGGTVIAPEEGQQRRQRKGARIGLMIESAVCVLLLGRVSQGPTGVVPGRPAAILHVGIGIGGSRVGRRCLRIQTGIGAALSRCFITVSETLAVNIVAKAVQLGVGKLIVRFSDAEKSNQSYTGN